jgi:hypothetical protein
MKALLTILFAICLSALFAQTGQISKPVSYQDTTISKCFFKYYTNYSVDTKKLDISIVVYGSKKSLQYSTNEIQVPEIIGSITVDMSADQSKTLAQLDNIARTAIKAKLKLNNPTWTNSDIIFY